MGQWAGGREAKGEPACGSRIEKRRSSARLRQSGRRGGDGRSHRPASGDEDFLCAVLFPERAVRTPAQGLNVLPRGRLWGCGHEPSAEGDEGRAEAKGKKGAREKPAERPRE